jgi:2'-5' RNA ligase
MRAFLAIDPDDESRRFLYARFDELRQMPWARHVRWIVPDKAHVTLRFLGEISEAQKDKLVASLRRDLAGLDDLPGLTATLTEPRLFPNPHKPRVVACLVETDLRLQRLSEIAESCAVGIGLKPETRGFHGHITLGRCRESFPRLNSLATKASTCEMTISELVLYRSELTRGGSIYTPIHRWPLS